MRYLGANTGARPGADPCSSARNDTDTGTGTGNEHISQ